MKNIFLCFLIVLISTNVECQSNLSLFTGDTIKVYKSCSGNWDKVLFYQPTFINKVNWRLVSKMKNLRGLDLSKCSLLDVHDAFVKLSKHQHLEYLVLDNNIIDKVSIPRHTFKKLNYLSLGNCSLHQIDSTIAGLVNLKYLNLGKKNSFVSFKNTLKNIPHEISFLKALEVLIVADNDFEVFPNIVCDLMNLKELDLSGNRITFLPANIANLKNLESLYLDYNNICFLPEDIKMIPKLKSIYMRDCCDKKEGTEILYSSISVFW